ncbi:MAG: metallopeptidase family protein, partial [Solirubrobacteraceae bacterium]
LFGLAFVSLASGASGSPVVRIAQGLAVFGAGTVLFIAVVVLVLTRVAGWQEPESESEFEAIVRRAERLAMQDRLRAIPPPDYADGTDDEFRAAVRAAIDDLPLEFHRALEHVAVVVSDGGAQRGAYGLYEGDTVAQDYFHDRIVIFRDTLERDFGHDPELLRAQVTRTLRHELAHHLGWGERGVRGLGL